MILVTGASGFLGRHLVPVLAERSPNASMRLFDAERGTHDLPESAQFVRGSIEEPSCVSAAVQGADVVIHLAAKVEPDSSDVQRLKHVNVEGACNVFSAAAAAGSKLFVHMSSTGVYGPPRSASAFREEDTLRPVTPYQKSKWEAEQRLQQIDPQGLTLNTLRPAGIYGAGTVVGIPIYRRLLKQRWSLEFSGGIEVHPTHVSDVAHAIAAILQRPAPHGSVFNIGGERPLLVSELYSLMANALEISRRCVVVPQWMAPLARAAAPLMTLAGRPNPLLASMIAGRSFSCAVDDTRFRKLYPRVAVKNLEEGLRDHVKWAQAIGLI